MGPCFTPLQKGAQPADTALGRCIPTTLAKWPFKEGARDAGPRPGSGAQRPLMAGRVEWELLRGGAWFMLLQNHVPRAIVPLGLTHYAPAGGLLI